MSNKTKRNITWEKVTGLSLCSLISGLWFGIGYTIVDLASNAWLQAKDSSPQKIAANDKE